MGRRKRWRPAFLYQTNSSLKTNPQVVYTPVGSSGRACSLTEEEERAERVLWRRGGGEEARKVDFVVPPWAFACEVVWRVGNDGTEGCRAGL